MHRAAAAAPLRHAMLFSSDYFFLRRYVFITTPSFHFASRHHMMPPRAAAAAFSARIIFTCRHTPLPLLISLRCVASRERVASLPAAAAACADHEHARRLSA